VGFTRLSDTVKITNDSGAPLGSSTDLSGNSRLLVDGFLGETNFDAFGRLRVSNPSTIFDGKQIFSEDLLVYGTSSAGGSEREYIQQASKVVLRVSGTSGDRYTYQTRQYFNYQPGKSQLIFNTFNLSGSQSGIDKCVGYFDNSNGYFLCLSSSNVNLVERSNVSGAVIDTAVSQSSWNLDKLDGTGVSGVNLDFTKTQILFTDIEWLGVGSARLGFVVDGVIRPAHAFHHANTFENVYMQSPNLPVRWELTATETLGAASDMAAICATVISEGGAKEQGLVFSADRGTTATSISTTEKPIISIRLNSVYNRMIAIPETFSILAASAGDFRWRLTLNSDISDIAAANWLPVSGSGVEYDITMSGSITNGTNLLTGYIANESKSGDVRISTNRIVPIASDYDGTSDILTLTLEKLSGTGVDVYGGLTWNEIR